MSADPNYEKKPPSWVNILGTEPVRSMVGELAGKLIAEVIVRHVVPTRQRGFRFTSRPFRLEFFF